MADKIIDSQRRWVILKVRENLKNTKSTDDTTWFDLAPYRNRMSFPDASMIESILEKADELWDIIKITERKHSKYEDTAEHPEVNWLVLKIDRKKFTELCHNYDIKGPDEDETEINSVFDKEKSVVTSKTSQLNNNLRDVESITFVVKNPGRNDKTWVVINNNFSNNVEFIFAGKRGGDSYIKTLYNLADCREEEFNVQTATSINSKILERAEFKGKYRQKTIVEKDGDKFRLNKDIKIVIKPMGMLNQEQLEFFPRN